MTTTASTDYEPTAADLEAYNTCRRDADDRQTALEGIDAGIEALQTIPGSEAALATLEAHRANVAAGGAFTPPPARKLTKEELRVIWQDAGPSLFR